MISIDVEVLGDFYGEYEISGTTLGHIAITGENGSISTKIDSDKVMIFITLTQLLDSVRVFIEQNKNITSLKLGMDAWFEPVLAKKGNAYQILHPRYRKKMISTSTKAELTEEVLRVAKTTYERYKKDFQHNDSGKIGLSDAIRDFEAFKAAKLSDLIEE